jgi:hypothetical protein
MTAFSRTAHMLCGVDLSGFAGHLDIITGWQSGRRFVRLADKEIDLARFIEKYSIRQAHGR